MIEWIKGLKLNSRTINGQLTTFACYGILILLFIIPVPKGNEQLLNTLAILAFANLTRVGRYNFPDREEKSKTP